MERRNGYQLRAPVMALMAAVILFAMVGTCDGRRVFDISIAQEKDWIDRGLDFFHGESDAGISGIGVRAGYITVYSPEERLMFVIGVVIAAGAVLLMICCCCVGLAGRRRSSRTLPPPVYIAPNANYAAAATMGTVGASAPIYPNFSNLTV